MKKNANVRDTIDELKLVPELLGLTAMNSFSSMLSASRSVMYLGQLSQAISLFNGEEKIIQTGIEQELGRTTFKKVFENDSRILDVLSKYTGMENGDINADIEITIIYLDLVLGEIDEVVIPNYDKNHNYFGFDYSFTTDLLNLEIDSIVPAGTVLAEPRTIKENNGYSFGCNLNMALVTLPEVGEDAIIISESAAKKLKFKLYETRRISFGKETIPMNLYGDNDEYKIIPDIGEYIRDDGILAATRTYDELNAPVLLSNKALRKPNPIMDNCIYVRGQGGKVIDIDVIHSPQGQRKNWFSGTEDQVQRYHKTKSKYEDRLLRTVNELSAKFNMPIGNKLHRHMTDVLVIKDPSVKNSFRKEPMSTYTVDVTLEYEVHPGAGYKFTASAGDKGVVGLVMRDEDMPMASDGTRAEIAMDPDSTIGRMNIGRLAEQYMNGVSRVVKKNVTKMYESHTPIMSIMDYINGCLKIIDNEQYKTYSSVNEEQGLEIVLDIVKNEFFIYIPVNSTKPIYEFISEFDNSVYAPLKKPIQVMTPKGPVVTDDPVMIAPMYMMLLSKIADSWLSSASSKVNHFGIPISSSKANKYRTPWSTNPVKNISETESRLFSGYASPTLMAELKERATSLDTHMELYLSILTAPEPANIDVAVDRKKVPFGTDVPLKIITSIFRTSGADIEFIDN